MKDITNYKVYYKVIGKFPDGRTLDSTNKENLYEDSFKLEEKKGFPAYAIAIIVVLGAAILAAGGFLAYKFLLAKPGVEMATLAVSENPEIIKSYGGEKALEKVGTTSMSKRSIKNKKIISSLNLKN